MANVISKDGTSIAYSKTGNGEPLILVDGALCSRAFGPLPKMAQLLAQHFTVYNYDRRGRNESGNTEPYSVEREIEDLEALIKEAGGWAFAAGFSSGAVLILRASAAGANIKKQILYEPPYVMNMGGHNPPADAEAQFKLMIAAGRRSDAVKFFMKDLIGLPAILPLIMSLTPTWAKLKAAAHTLPYDMAVMGNFSIPVNIAAAAKSPALVVAGEKTAISLKNASQQLVKDMPNAQFKSLKGQAHNVSPKVMVPAILEYLKN